MLLMISTFVLISLGRYLCWWTVSIECIIRPVVSASTLTWLSRYIQYCNLLFLHNVNIDKTKVLLPQAQLILAEFWVFCKGPLVLLLPKHLIIWVSNLSILSVPDEDYSRNASCTLNLITTFSQCSGYVTVLILDHLRELSYNLIRLSITCT